MSKIFEFSISTDLQKSKNWKTWKFIKTQNYQSKCFTSGSWKFLKFSDFQFFPFYWNRKLQKWRIFFKTNFFKEFFFYTWRSWKFQRLLCCWFWLLHWNQKLRKLVILFNFWKFQSSWFVWGKWKFMRFPSFQFWPLHWNWKLWKLGTWNKKFVFFEEVGDLQSFQVFSFGTYSEIENSKKLENFPRFAVFKKFVLFEKVKNFRYFWVFDFGPYIEIKDSQKIGNNFKTCKYQSRCFI